MAGWNQIVNELYDVLNEVNDHYYDCVQGIYLDTRFSLGDRVWKITRRNYEHFAYQYGHLQTKLKELGATIDFSNETLRQEIQDWTKVKIAALKADLENQIDDAKGVLLDIIEEIETALKADIEGRLIALETDMSDVWAWMDEEYYTTIEQVQINIQDNSIEIERILNDVIEPIRLIVVLQSIVFAAGISENSQNIIKNKSEIEEKLAEEVKTIQDEMEYQIDDIYDNILFRYASLYDYIDNEIEFVLHVLDDPEEQLRWALNISAQQWQVIDANLKLILINSLS